MARAFDAADQTLAGRLVQFTVAQGLLTLTQGNTDATGTVRTTLVTGGDARNREIVVTARGESAVAERRIQVVGTMLTIEGPNTVFPGTATTYRLWLRDAADKGIAAQPLDVATEAGNALRAPQVSSDAQGLAEVTLTATLAASSLTASGYGLCATWQVAVARNELFFSSPANNSLQRFDAGRLSTEVELRWTLGGATVADGTGLSITVAGAARADAGVVRTRSGAARFVVEGSGIGDVVVTARGLALGQPVAELRFRQASPAPRPMELLVPAYFRPDWPTNYWPVMKEALREGVALTAVFSPLVGPTDKRDPAYVAAIDDLRAAGGRALGYVHTAVNLPAKILRPVADVRLDVDRYATFYGAALDGIFVDEMIHEPGDSSYLDFYADLYAYIKARYPAYRVVGNPGWQATELHLTRPTADAVVVYENLASASYVEPPADSWLRRHQNTRIGHIIYAAPSAADMQALVARASRDNAGLIYVTNDLLPNPYDTLPAYFTALVAAVKATSGT
ncbi:MAG: spherulation-specific family 4 protein [Betaproteobacteria bacterium]